MMRCRLHYTFTAEFASKRIVKNVTASEVTTLWRYTNLFIIITIIIN